MFTAATNDWLVKGLKDPEPNLEIGLRKARAATLMLLGLPGSVYLYQ